MEGPADGDEGDGVEGSGERLGVFVAYDGSPYLARLRAKSSKEGL